jgi:hypothetical protein
MINKIRSFEKYLAIKRELNHLLTIGASDAEVLDARNRLEDAKPPGFPSVQPEDEGGLRLPVPGVRRESK